jgi:16S rRNA (adenine1518-N6/adenine1519-N6)-dimethyltransferase
MQKTHKAKKTLGQNFLKSEQALREIVKAGDIKLDDTVLEIGPGKGALTERLLENSVRVIATEKDHDLVAFLNDKFKEEIENLKFK